MCGEIERAGTKAVPLAADVTAADGPARIVDRALAAGGGIDALVNAAGIIASGGVVETRPTRGGTR